MASKASTSPKSAKIREKYIDILKSIESAYPEMPQFLTYHNAFELLISVILSAQTTDNQVNKVTPALFAAFPNPEALSTAGQSEVENLVSSTGFFRQKAKNIIATAQKLMKDFGGLVPNTMEDLTSLAGVGRKTAGVILYQIYNKPAIIVDTHFGRFCKRTGLTKSDDPLRIEADLSIIAPPETWGSASMRFNLHGRLVCKSRGPNCKACVVSKHCSFYLNHDSKA